MVERFFLQPGKEGSFSSPVSFWRKKEGGEDAP
jgi:hypothetical protein